jgi:DNA polymerase III subunit delta'
MNTIYPWQENQWRQVLGYLHNDRLPHGLLLTGPKGLGKLHFAQILAKHMLAQKQSAQLENHPDLLQIQPSAEGKIINVEQIREVVAGLNHTAQQSGWRVVIIEPAEMMNKTATNALLKTLEEPPQQVLFLLISHQSGALLATVRSRCQCLAFTAPDAALSFSWLKQQLPSHLHDKLPRLLAWAEGLPLLALNLSQEDQLPAYERVFESFITMSTGAMDPVEMAAVCSDMDFSIVFNALWSIIMDLLRLKANLNNPQMLTNPHQLPALTLVNRQLSYDKMIQFLDELMEACRHIQAKINLNIQLLWEGLFIRIFYG